MAECTCDCARFGQKISPLNFSAYDPNEGGFVEVSSEKILSGGKWLILVFYPADFTFVCPTELADIAAQHEALKKSGAEIISVSTDNKFVHLAWRNAEKLLENVRFLMGSDPTGAISRYFGIYDEAGGTSYRGTFIINPDGVLVGSEVNFYNVGRNAQELLRKVRANAYLRKNPVEVCPANWEEGKKTLKPSPQIVGKVYEALK
ncbi:MAG: redoxin domain-containing protein [Deltaproteobacteria bacterium]|jgi:peroxiredoxin (alkyl hydroperoxide reductase subunit C)|nr:redoxin domain-containing protein [Deltaproteobacteria bacterium]